MALIKLSFSAIALMGILIYGLACLLGANRGFLSKINISLSVVILCVVAWIATIIYLEPVQGLAPLITISGSIKYAGILSVIAGAVFMFINYWSHPKVKIGLTFLAFLALSYGVYLECRTAIYMKNKFQCPVARKPTEEELAKARASLADVLVSYQPDFWELHFKYKLKCP